MQTQELVILSRDGARVYEPAGAEICISITDPAGAEIPLSSKFMAVLRLAFDDVLAATEPQHVLFAAEHADAIVRFVAAWPTADRIVVHCVGGVSRSPGVALGLCDRRGWKTAWLEQQYPFWNTLVRKKLATHGAVASSH